MMASGSSAKLLSYVLVYCYIDTCGWKRDLAGLICILVILHEIVEAKYVAQACRVQMAYMKTDMPCNESLKHIVARATFCT